MHYYSGTTGLAVFDPCTYEHKSCRRPHLQALSLGRATGVVVPGENPGILVVATPPSL